MRYPDRLDREAIADLVVKLRPEWKRWLVVSVLQAHSHNVDLFDMATAALRIASDRSVTTEKALGWKSKHWAGLSTAPVVVTESRARCTICGKPERQCLTERPGPDDHEFDPSSTVAVR